MTIVLLLGAIICLYLMFYYHEYILPRIIERDIKKLKEFNTRYTAQINKLLKEIQND